MDPTPFFHQEKITDPATQAIWCLAALLLLQAPPSALDIVNNGEIFCLANGPINAWNEHPALTGCYSTAVVHILRDDWAPTFLPADACWALELIPSFIPADRERAALHLSCLSHLRHEQSAGRSRSWTVAHVMEAHEAWLEQTQNPRIGCHGANVEQVKAVLDLLERRLAATTLPPQHEQAS